MRGDRNCIYHPENYDKYHNQYSKLAKAYSDTCNHCLEVTDCDLKRSFEDHLNKYRFGDGNVRVFIEHKLDAKQVIFNPPATIVFWHDGTKTVVKASNEPFDREKGLAMAICKRMAENKGNYYDIFRKFCHDEPPFVYRYNEQAPTTDERKTE